MIESFLCNKPKIWQTNSFWLEFKVQINLIFWIYFELYCWFKRTNRILFIFYSTWLSQFKYVCLFREYQVKDESVELA